MAEPFAFAEYRKQKLREKIEKKRERTRIPLPVRFQFELDRYNFYRYLDRASG